MKKVQTSTSIDKVDYKLAIDKRISFYEKLLEIVCKDTRTCFGFCYYISSYWHMESKRIYAYDDKIFAKELPELWDERPNKSKKASLGYWFPTSYEGWELRITLLVKVIEKLKKLRATLS